MGVAWRTPRQVVSSWWLAVSAGKGNQKTRGRAVRRVVAGNISQNTWDHPAISVQTPVYPP